MFVRFRLRLCPLPSRVPLFSFVAVYDPVKTGLSESEAETEEPMTIPEIEHCDWFILRLLLAIPGHSDKFRILVAKFHKVISNLVPRVSHLIAPRSERGETLVGSGHVPLGQLKTSGRGPL